MKRNAILSIMCFSAITIIGPITAYAGIKVDGVVQTQGQTVNESIDARTLYDEVMIKTKETQDMSATVKIETTGGYDHHMLMERDMKMTGLRTSEAKFLFDIKYKLKGINYDSLNRIFYTGGYAYKDVSYSEYKESTFYKPWSTKTTMSPDEVVLLSTNGIPEPQNLLDIQVNEDENGNRIFTFVGSPEGLDEAMFLYYRMSKGLSEPTSATLAARIRDYQGTIYVNPNGYITASDIIINYDEEIKGIKGNAQINFEMKINAIYHNPGQSVSLTVPSTEGYRLVDRDGNSL